MVEVYDFEGVSGGVVAIDEPILLLLLLLLLGLKFRRGKWRRGCN
jgi:hypothetical protein